VEAVFIDHLEDLVVVAIVNMNPDDHRALAVIQGWLQHGCDFLGRPDQHSGGAKCLGELDYIRGPKLTPDFRPYLAISPTPTMSYDPSIQTMWTMF
jgi:hypothetical protein